jgi:glycosyltransferase involved in cell wall biosynthesis
MRVAILTHYFPPEVGAPQTRLQALARGLAGRGVEVSVHTCAPHYPDGVVRPGHANALWRREVVDGLEVIRSWVLPAANRGVARRLLDHASFAASAIATAPLAGRVDFVIAETPPLFLAAAAPLYARIRGAKAIVHVSDLWPDSVVELGMIESRRAIDAARTLERHAYRRATRIVAPTRGIAETLAGRPEAAGKVRRLPPAVDLDRFTVPPLRRDGALRVLYAGTVGMAQGLGTLVSAAARIDPDLVGVTIAGAGAELDHVRAAAASVPNVDVLGPVAADAVPRLYADSDAAVVLLRDRPIFRGALPTKLFEAMAAGRPLVLAAEGESADLVRHAGAGVVVAPEDPVALAAALTDLARLPEQELREIGARAAGAATGFDRRAMVDSWLELLEQAAAG